ncbi:MAG TPA: aminoacyl-tRNA hydrolase [Bacteroidetes bacterium]|nr:aminoacyl-tRNA hydrolase [Bacteroidota bacterium]
MLNHKLILKECFFKTSRSSGAGGQHVNKVETKVTLYFDIINSKTLSQNQKNVLIVKLKNKIDKSGILTISSQKSRSQLKNKKATEIKLIQLLEKSLKPEKRRIPVKVSNSAIEKRLKNKKIRSVLKKTRNKNTLNYE